MVVTNSLTKVRSKKEIILEMLQEGKYTDGEIAQKANTTILYVWKLKNAFNKSASNEKVALPPKEIQHVSTGSHQTEQVILPDKKNHTKRNLQQYHNRFQRVR